MLGKVISHDHIVHTEVGYSNYSLFCFCVDISDVCELPPAVFYIFKMSDSDAEERRKGLNTFIATICLALGLLTRFESLFYLYIDIKSHLLKTFYL